MNSQAICFGHVEPSKFHTLQIKFALEISFIAAKTLRIKWNFYAAIGSNFCLVCRDTNDTCEVHSRLQLSWYHKIYCYKINSEFNYFPTSTTFLWRLKETYLFHQHFVWNVLSDYMASHTRKLIILLTSVKTSNIAVTLVIMEVTN